MMALSHVSFKIDQDGNGLIEKEEFVTHFNRALARERFEFDNTMVQFMQVGGTVGAGV